MKLKLPRKKKVLKKKTSSTVSTASASASASASSSPSHPLSPSASSVTNDTINLTLDDGRPSHSALNDLHRVLKLIEAERHLAAYQLYSHAKERIVSNATSSTDTSLASARTLLNGRRHEFRTLERRSDIFGAAKLNLAANNDDNNNNNDSDVSSSSWILAQTLFGITTYYRREPIDNSLSIKIEGELSDVSIPLFEQIVVLRECDLYHIWAPFMTKSRKLAQLDKLDVVAWYEVGVPLLGLMRDACYRAVGCACMKEDGTVLLVAVGLNDSEEHGVKNFISLNTGGGGGSGGDSGRDDDDGNNAHDNQLEKERRLESTISPLSLPLLLLYVCLFLSINSAKHFYRVL